MQVPVYKGEPGDFPVIQEADTALLEQTDLVIEAAMADVLKVASLIEREAGSDEERATIASVIYNRLESDSFPYLGLDSTIHYAIAGTDGEFSTELDSPYNSYTNAGLPPTPIANPGMSSIKAALNPDDTDYYYFALSISVTHEFFTNSDSFYAFINSEEYAG